MCYEYKPEEISRYNFCVTGIDQLGNVKVMCKELRLCFYVEITVADYKLRTEWNQCAFKNNIDGNLRKELQNNAEFSEAVFSTAVRWMCEHKRLYQSPIGPWYVEFLYSRKPTSGEIIVGDSRTHWMTISLSEMLFNNEGNPKSWITYIDGLRYFRSPLDYKSIKF